MTTTLQHRGRCRLMLRIPAWKAEFRDASDPDFLDVCEAYELTWQGLTIFGSRQSWDRFDEFCELAVWLENEALTLALLTRNRHAL